MTTQLESSTVVTSERAPVAFISYSHADANIIDRLRTHLKPIEKKYKFIVWDDKRLRAGDKWRQEIERNMNIADVIVVLLSADFLASNFIMDYEYPIALEAASSRGAKIVVMIASPCLYEEFEIADFHFINDPNETLQDMQSDERAAESERILVKCVATIRDYLREKAESRRKLSPGG